MPISGIFGRFPAVTGVLVIFTLPVTHGHGYLSFPAAVYRDPYTATSFVTTITESVNPAVFGGKKWNDSPELNAAKFAAAFYHSTYHSLRELVEPFVFGCGNTRVDVPPVNVTGAIEMHWQNDQEHRGFVDSHHGPCEVWIDNHLALHNDDCRSTFVSYPARLPVDYDSLCNGDCNFTFYWMALHEPAWQIYKACTPITT